MKKYDTDSNSLQTPPPLGWRDIARVIFSAFQSILFLVGISALLALSLGTLSLLINAVQTDSWQHAILQVQLLWLMAVTDPNPKYYAGVLAIRSCVVLIPIIVCFSVAINPELSRRHKVGWICAMSIGTLLMLGGIVALVYWLYLWRRKDVWMRVFAALPILCAMMYLLLHNYESAGWLALAPLVLLYVGRYVYISSSSLRDWWRWQMFSQRRAVSRVGTVEEGMTLETFGNAELKDSDPKAIQCQPPQEPAGDIITIGQPKDRVLVNSQVVDELLSRKDLEE